jgi:hypothetical protein
MSYNWGPHFIVPSDTLHAFSGTVVLRESFDNELLEKELEELGYSGIPYSATNPWYFRKRGQETWIKIGESTDRKNNFPVQWDTTKVKNGEYEIFGLMHVTLRENGNEFVICRQNSAKVQVTN